MPGVPDSFIHDPCGSLFFGTILLCLGYFISGRNDRTWNKALRITAIAYVACIAVEGLDAGPDRIDVWIKAAVMSLIPATYVMAVSLMGITALSFLHERLIARPSRAWRKWRGDVRYARMREKEAADLERQRVRDQLRWEADAPKREAAAREAAARAQVEAEYRRRREDSRAAALREYQKYAPRLKDRMFARSDFDQYLERYMGDNQPPDVVESRGQSLIASFEEMLHDVEPPKKQRTTESLITWYQEQEAKIRAMPLEDKQKNVHLVLLRRKFDELMRQHLLDSEP